MNKFLLLLIIATSFTSSFKLSSTSLEDIVEGNWKYDHSYNDDREFVFDGEYYQNNPIPERIEFNRISKRTNKKIKNKYSWLHELRKNDELRNISFWVDYKGRTKYPIVISKEMDSLNNPINIQIDLLDELYPNERTSLRIISADKNKLVISNYRGNSNQDKHVYTQEY